MNFTEHLLSHAFKLAQDPRISRALQRPEVMGGVMAAMRLGVRIAERVSTTRETLLHSLNLASRDDLEALQRHVYDLQRQLDAQGHSPRKRR